LFYEKNSELGRKSFTTALLEEKKKASDKKGNTLNLYCVQSQKFKTMNLQPQNKANKKCIRSNIKVAKEVESENVGQRKTVHTVKITSHTSTL
jgi:hypothetical protein